MKRDDRWELCAHLPPDSALSQDGRRMRVVLHPAVIAPAVVAVPLLADEAAVWAKPLASACFPLHPLGFLGLFDRARRLLSATGMAGELSPEQLAYAEERIARFAAELYKPGHSIRVRLDALVEDREFQLREDDRDPFVAQPGHLAAWAVVRAALDWATEAT